RASSYAWASSTSAISRCRQGLADHHMRCPDVVRRDEHAARALPSQRRFPAQLHGPVEPYPHQSQAVVAPPGLIGTPWPIPPTSTVRQAGGAGSVSDRMGIGVNELLIVKGLGNTGRIEALGMADSRWPRSSRA